MAIGRKTAPKTGQARENRPKNPDRMTGGRFRRIANWGSHAI
jgi:hypothetical protein